MRAFAVGFLLGDLALAVGRHLPSSIGLVLTVFLLLLGAGILVRIKRIVTSLLLGFALGLAWTGWIATQQWQHSLNPNLAEKTLIADGKIVGIPERSELGWRFEFQIKQLLLDGQAQMAPDLVRISWIGQAPNLSPGDEWRLALRLKPPRSTLNPGAFDYEAWLFSQQIHAVGYVVTNSDNQLIKSSLIYSCLDRWRQQLAQAITQDLQGNSYAGFITAFTVGVRDQITAAQWQTLQITGTDHLIAIAGLHIGLVTGFVYLLVNFLWRRFARLTLIVPAPIAAIIAALLAAVIYASLAGFSLPTQRALIMVAVFSLGVLSRRQLPPWHAYCLALILVLCLDPLSVLDPSFWLSFTAVGLILYYFSHHSALNALPEWRQFLQIQWLLTLGLIPLTLLFFQTISLVGFIANLIAIPVIGFIVMPLSLFGIICYYFSKAAAKLCWILAAHICGLIWPAIVKIGNIHWLQWHGGAVHPWTIVIAIIGILWYFAPEKIPVRWCGLLGLLPIFIIPAARPQYGEVWFTLLDVGQGLASVIQTQHHLIIYDTGPRSENFDAGAAIVLPFLRANQLNNIDLMVVSHGDNDHSGGAAAIINTLPVKQIRTSIPALFPANLTQACVAGQQWDWDGVHFTFIYPPPGQPYADNNSSCILKVSAGNHSLLLTGDIEKPSEDYLLQNAANFLPSDIIVVPHHGSPTSSSTNFVNAIHPQYALFSYGYFNRFHFPSAMVLSRYQQDGTKIYDTVDCGSITLKFNPTQIFEPECYRKLHGHYWNF